MEASTETRLHGRLHGLVAARIQVRLGPYVEEHALGETYVATGFQLGAGTESVVAPDLSFVHRDRLEMDETTDGHLLAPPDLAIEVVEPSDSFEAVTGLLGDLLGAGCPMVAIINPTARTATVFRSNGRGLVLAVDDVLDGGDVVPGWKLVLRDVFT